MKKHIALLLFVAIPYLILAQGNRIKARDFLNKGTLFGNQFKTEEALKYYSKAIKSDASFDTAYVYRGSVYSYQNKYELAIADYSRAIQLNPMYEMAYILRATTYSLQVKLPEAMADYSKVIEINPGNVKAYSERGAGYFLLGEIDLACADLVLAKILGATNVDDLLQYCHDTIASIEVMEKDEAFPDLRTNYFQQTYLDSLYYDTIQSGSYLYIFSPIDTSEYFSLIRNYAVPIVYPHFEREWLSEPMLRQKYHDQILIRDSALIKLVDSTYIIGTGENKTSFRVFEALNMYESIEYQYIEFIPQVNSYLFWKGWYEGGSFQLIRTDLKQTRNIWGYPRFSADGRYMLTCSHDLWAGRFYNGFEVYEVTPDGIKCIHAFATEWEDNWGVAGAFFKDNNTIYFSHVFLHPDNPGSISRFLQQVTIKKK